MRDVTYFPQFSTPEGAIRSYYPVGPAQVVQRQPASVRLRAGSSRVEVAVLAPDLFRVGMFGEGRPIEYTSEAVARPDWDSGPVEVREQDGTLVLATPMANACLQLDPLRIRFEDASGRCFADDDPDLGMGIFAYSPELEIVDPIGAPVRVYKRRAPTERYFGCGERTGGLEKTGTHQVFWNIDPPSHHTAALNNLYTSIPFLLVLDRGNAWGLFFDNTHRVEFDLADERPERSWFGADGGDLVYYVFAGPTPRSVLERYTQLTGRTPLPPLWALGNHQSRWGYRTADELRAIAREFREREIPCDALYLDIDYMDGYRVFTWDSERFPDPKGLLAELAGQGFRVVTILDPGIKVDENYPVYVSGRDADLYCQTFRGEEYRNVVWPGVCAFPDFTNPRAREWWASQLPALVDQGVAGIWCDMNEPSVFIPTPATLPPDAVHPGGARPRLHAQVHNAYGSLMAQATREGLERLQPERRPFVISRSGYAGLQRHALHWTGDNSSWWEHVAMSLPQLQNLGLSGLAWVGVDVGGFAGDATGELLTRWTEAGIFYPFYRNHSAWNTRPQEPWGFGPLYEAHLRSLLKLRQRLIPYLYSLFEESHRTGAPILRPLLFEYPDDPATYTAEDQFLLGPALLVAPISRQGTEYRSVYLPRGTWRHFWTGEVADGPGHVLAHAPLGQPAVYLRANTPIPLWPEMQYVGERPADPLTVLVCAAEGDGEFWLYEDAGDGYAHEGGAFARTQLASKVARDVVSITIGERVGGFVPERNAIELEVRGIGVQPSAVVVNGAPAVPWQREGDTLRLRLASNATAQQVEIHV